jgi:spore coat polysaccharide biosynthesis protein SpsF
MDLSTWQGMRTRDPRRLVLGSAGWGTPDALAHRSAPPSDASLQAMLDRAAEHGVRTLDTARAYGASESRIGEALAKRPSDDRFRVITRLAPDVHTQGLGIAETLERTLESLARSREALGLESLPVVLLHRFEHRHACGGKLWRLLLAEREAGRIGTLGVSAATPEEAWAALEDPDLSVQQVASSLLDLRLVREGFFARARELGRTIYVRSVFLEGVACLDPNALPPYLAGLAPAVATIRKVAEGLGVPAAAVYLAFARELLPGAHPVVRCESEAQLAELLSYWVSDRIDLATLSPLVESLPTHGAETVDPARWPVRAPLASNESSQPATNRTASESIATLPS